MAVVSTTATATLTETIIMVTEAIALEMAIDPILQAHLAVPLHLVSKQPRAVMITTGALENHPAGSVNTVAPRSGNSGGFSRPQQDRQTTTECIS